MAMGDERLAGSFGCQLSLVQPGGEGNDLGIGGQGLGTGDAARRLLLDRGLTYLIRYELRVVNET
jgi:hypothetical protein